MSTRAPVTPERDVQAAVLDCLRRVFHVDIDRQNVGMGEYRNADGTTRKVRFGKAGNLDLSGTLGSGDGRRIEIEVKRKGKKPTPAQMERIRSINRAGGVAFWVNDLEQILRIMPLILQGAWIVEEQGEFFATDGR